MARKSEILFIDPAVSDIKTLLAGLRPDVDAVLLESGRPAEQQMAEALARRSDLAAVHVIAHGAPGQVHFSGGQWSAATLASVADDLAAIGKALRPGGDVRLWSCCAGAGSKGAALTECLAEAAGVPVASSLAHVGAGTWVLGTAAQPPLTKEAIRGYTGVLATRSRSLVNLLLQVSKVTPTAQST